MTKLEEVFERFVAAAANAGYSRDELVPGSGNINARIVLIGEAPGRYEVEQKRPFVGKAGALLDAFLQKTGIKRDELYITNAVKLRPYRVSEKGTRSNRPPNAAELGLCGECLKEELAVLAPDMIVTLGNTPLRAVTGDRTLTVGECHGRLTEKNGYRIFPIYHPASMIYNRSLAQVYEEDLLKLRTLV